MLQEKLFDLDSILDQVSVLRIINISFFSEPTLLPTLPPLYVCRSIKGKIFILKLLSRRSKNVLIAGNF